MGFNRRFLPELEVLVEYLKMHGAEEFYKKWVKGADSFNGPAESVEFVMNFTSNKK